MQDRKSALNSYFLFSRKERLGILILLTIILVMLSSSLWLPYCFPAGNRPDQQRLDATWNELQARLKTEQDQAESLSMQAELFAFDPNTLDSAGFIKLGLQPRTVHYLLNWRNKGKHFYRKEDLKPLYSLSDEAYRRLAPFIHIVQGNNTDTYAPYPQTVLPPLPAHIELNQTDSVTLVRLKGIGPTLAGKILQRRNALGGFLHHEQLLEIYRFPDTTFAYLKEKLQIDPAGIHKINLNTATETQLSRHPYIGETMARNIILLRSGFSKYEKVTQLRQVPLMNEEKYRKIAPYCTIE